MKGSILFNRPALVSYISGDVFQGCLLSQIILLLTFSRRYPSLGFKRLFLKVCKFLACVLMVSSDSQYSYTSTSDTELYRPAAEIERPNHISKILSTTKPDEEKERKSITEIHAEGIENILTRYESSTHGIGPIESVLDEEKPEQFEVKPDTKLNEWDPWHYSVDSETGVQNCAICR